MKAISFEALKRAVTKLGHPWFTSGDFNLNLVGIRSDDIDSNAFNDLVCVAFYQGGQPVCLQFPATTDPGLYYRTNPINVSGTAILTAGHHRGIWEIGKHQGKYEALVQRRPVTVHRDADKDGRIDLSAGTETGLFGINLHRAREDGRSMQVDRWSAGCQVVAKSQDFDILMAVVRRARTQWPNYFSYTLINESDL